MKLTFHQSAKQMADAFRAYEAGERQLVFVVYHKGHRARTPRLFSTGFQPTPWRCCRCKQKVGHPDNLQYSLASYPLRTKRRLTLDKTVARLIRKHSR